MLFFKSIFSNFKFTYTSIINLIKSVQFTTNIFNKLFAIKTKITVKYNTIIYFNINPYFEILIKNLFNIKTKIIVKFNDIRHIIVKIYTYSIKIKNYCFSLNIVIKVNKYFIIVINKLLNIFVQFKKLKKYIYNNYKINNIPSDELNFLDQFFLKKIKEEDINFSNTVENNSKLSNMIKNITENNYYKEMIKNGISEEDKYKIIKKYLKNKFKN